MGNKNKTQPDSSAPLINQITGAGNQIQTPGTMGASVPRIPVPAPTPNPLGGPSLELMDRIRHETEQHRARMQQYVQGLQRTYQQYRQNEDAINAHAIEEARKADPFTPASANDALVKQYAARIKQDIEKQQRQAAQSIPDVTIRNMLGLQKDGPMAKALRERRNTLQQGEDWNKNNPDASPVKKFLTGLDVGATSALNTLAGKEKYAIQTNDIEDEQGNLTPEFKRKLYELSGGNLSSYSDVGKSLLNQRIGEYDQSPSIVSDVTGKTMNALHDSYDIPVLKHVLRTPYYLASGALSGIKAAVKAGTTIGYGVSSALPGGDQHQISQQYADFLHGINQYQTQSNHEGDVQFRPLNFLDNLLRGNPSLDNLGNLDALLGSTARFMGEMEALGPLAKMGGQPNAGAAFERVANNAAIGAAATEKGILANTAANKLYAGVNKAVQGLSDAKLPMYIDNVVSTGKMFFPSMYADYYQDALTKGYSPDQAGEVAAQRATVAIAAMALGNWAGAGKTPADKLPQQILQGVDKEVAKSFLGKAGQFTEKLIARTDPKNAAAGGLGMASSAFLDGVQDHYEAIQRGEIPPDTPLDIEKISHQAAEHGLIGFLSMGLSHVLAGHGNMPETPQATAIYNAAADPKAFRIAVARQVERGKVTPQEGDALLGFVGRIADRPEPHIPSLLEQGYAKTKSPESAVKWAIEQARLQETAEAITELSKQTEVVKMTDEAGNPVEKVYARDAQGNMTEAAGAEITRQLADLKGKAAESERAIQQLTEGSMVRGRTVGGDELLRLTSKYTPEGSLTTQQASRIIGEGPFVTERVDLLPYTADPRVVDFIAQMATSKNFQPKNANDPIIGANREIIDGIKRIAYALSQGQTEMSVLRPRTMQEAAKSAQEERESLIGTDAPVSADPKVQAVAEVYQHGLDREAVPEDQSLGLTTPAIRAVWDAAKEVADLPKEQAIETIHEATNHTVAPAVVEHVVNVSRGEKPAESAFERPEEVAQTTAADPVELYRAIPEITESPLWDKETNSPREGVTADDLAEFHITGELPEHLQHLQMPVEIAPEAPLSGPALVDFTTSSGNKVFVENGQLKVVNKNGEPVSENTRRKAILEAAQAHDFTQGESVSFPDGSENWSMQQIEQHVAETSQNPSELATLWLYSEREGEVLSSVEESVLRNGIGSTTTQSFDRFGDRNYRNNALARTYLNNEKGVPLDEIAREISDREGIEVTPQDLVDFMVRFPNGGAERTFQSKAAETAATRFEELTGFPLNEKIPTTRKIAELAQQQAVDKLAAEERATLDNFLEHEYTTREQADRAFEEAVQAGHINPAGENDRLYDGQDPRQGQEIQGSPEGQTGTPAEAGANELPGDSRAGEPAPSVIGEPVSQKGPVSYYVDGKTVTSAGWTKTSAGGIQEFAHRLADKFGARVSIVGREQMQALAGRDAEAFVQDGQLFINIEHPSLKPSALMEESAHLWIEWARTKATGIHDAGIELAKQSIMYKYMEALHTGGELPEGLSGAQQREAKAYVEAYRNHSDPLYSLANEVLAKAIRDEGKSLATEPDMRRNFGKWLQSFWNAVKSGLGFSNINTVDFARLKLSDYARRAAEEIGSGKPLTTRIKEERTRAQAMRERAERQASTLPDTLDRLEAGDRLDIANAKPSSNPLGEGSQVIATGATKEAPLTDDPVINGIGRGGGGEIAAVVEKQSPELYKEMVDAVGDANTLADVLTNPEMATPEQKAALGMDYTKRRGGSYEMKDGLMSRALTVLSEVMGETHTPAEIVKGLAEYHEVLAAREAEHRAAVQRGRENQQAGAEKKLAKGEAAFVDALVDKIQTGENLRGRDIVALAKEYGIKDQGTIDRLQQAATDKLLANEQLYSVGSDYSPRDEREDFMKLMEQAAENPETFHVEALKLIRAGYQSGMIDRATALDLHKKVGESVGNEQKIFELLDKARAELLPDEPAAPAKEPSVTSIKNAQVDEERARLGMAPAMKSASYEFQQVWDEALRVLDKTPEASANLLNELRIKVRPLTGVENALLLHRQITFQTEQRALAEEVNNLAATGNPIELAAAHARLGEVMQELQDIYDLGKAAGAENSKGLNTRRMMAAEDYTLQAMVARERAAAGGTLTPEAEAQITELHRKLEEAQKKIDAFEKKKASDKEGQAFEKVKRTVDPKERKPAGRKESILERIRAKVGAPNRDAMFSLAEDIPVNPKALESAAEIKELVKYYVEEGYTDRAEILDMVHHDLLEIVPELTRRDVGEAFSEYGKTSEPTKDEIQRQLTELKAQERLALAYEDAMRGAAPKKSGFQRGKPSDTVREMQRKVKAAMEEAGIKTTDPDKQLASALDAIKSRLRNQIADLNKQLLTGEKSIKKPGTPYDTEALALRAERDRLRTELEAIEGKKEMTDEQRVKIATSAVERSIKEYERRIAENDLSPQNPDSKTPETQELKDLRAQREALREQYDKMVRAANPPKSPEQKATDAALRATEKSIADMEARLASGNPSATKKQSLVQDTPELVAARQKRDQLRDQLDQLNRQLHPAKTAEEKATDAAIRAATKRIQELQDMIASGNINPAPKQSLVQDTPQLQQLRTEREQLQNTLDQLREAANPKKSPEEAALDRFKANIRRRIADMEERMRTGNYEKTERVKIEPDSEALQLSLERERVKREFDKRVEKYRLGQRSKWERIKEGALDVFNLPKGLLSTLDMSAPLRQGIILSAGNPKEGAAAFGEMFRQAMSKVREEKWLHALHESPIWPTMQQAKLYIAEPSAKLEAKEEQFMTNLAHKIPLYGKLVGFSERAYTGFLNKIRADVFAKGVEQLQKNPDIPREQLQKAYADLADFINNATGRGKLGALEPAAGVLNGLFFSPRMLASRLNLMNPVKYAQMHPEVRKMAMKNMLAYVGFGIAILSLAAAAGADVEPDPRSADFGKMKFGDTRYDIWAGYVPIIRTIAQFSKAQRKSTSSGEIIDLDGTGYGGQDKWTPVQKFFRTKLAPVPGSVLNLTTGKDVLGQETSISKEALKSVVPLYVQDVAQIIANPGGGGGVTDVAKTAVPAFFGVGVQRYPSR